MPATLLLSGVYNASSGPGPQPTGLLAKFRLRYPEFAAISDARVEYWLDDATSVVTADWGVDEEPATLVYAAHRVARSATTGMSAIPAGVTRFRSGSMDVAFTESAANALSSGGYESTPYGQEFAVYLRRNRGGPRLIGCGYGDRP